MYVLISLIVAITLQCLHISNHHILHLKYVQILSGNYTSVKQGKNIMGLSSGINLIVIFTTILSIMVALSN